MAYLDLVHRGRWIKGKHLVYMCNKVQDFLKDDLYDERGNLCKILIICMPPQHGKSMAISESLPSWFLGNNPDKRVILISYNTDFARKFGRRNLNKLKEFGHEFFGISLSKQQDDEVEIEDHTGSMISRGVLSGITGNPGDLIIIDDCIKNREEALSDTYREKIWDEYLASIKTRLSSSGKIILIQTRWHEDDLAGRVIQNEGDKVVEINFPCEAEEFDILGRKKGEALFPEIGKDTEWLQDFKRSYITQSGHRTWVSLFQGRPSAIEGNLLKRSWWKYYDEMPPAFDRICQSWDCAFKDNDNSSYVVGQVWGMIDLDCYLLDQIRARIDYPTTKREIINMTRKWPLTNRIFIEDKANGSAVIQELQSSIPGIIPVDDKGGKIARASAMSGYLESGHLFIPKNAPFVNDFLDECSAFPDSVNSDQVDAMSQAINHMMYYRNIEKPQKPYMVGAVYYRAELRMKGFSDYEINAMNKAGKIILKGA